MGRKNEEYEGDSEDFIALQLSAHAKRSIVAVLLFVIAVIFVLGFFDASGIAGEKLTQLSGMIFGFGKYLAPLVFVYAGIVLLRKKVETRFYVTKIIGIAIAFWGVLALMHIIPFNVEDFKEVAQGGKGGGYLGYVLAVGLVKFTGKIAGIVILIALGVVGLIIAFNMSLVGLGDYVPVIKKTWEGDEGFFTRRKNKKKDDIDKYEDGNELGDEEKMEEDTSVDDSSEEFDDEEFDDKELDDGQTIDMADYVTESISETEVKIDDAQKDKIQKVVDAHNSDTKQMTQSADVDWELPPLKLLTRGGDKAKGGDVKQRALNIQETFKNFGIEMELEDIVTGPTVTQYSFRPQSGVKLSRITALNADLALSLAAHPIRIEAPIPGKSLVGIEVPNKATAIVRMRELFNTDEFDEPDKKLLLALGEDVNGDYVYEDLAKMPHLLVAGTTGAGKSVTINCILLSLLYKNSPEELKLILVDPKRVELSLYSGIPHLLSDVIVDNGKVLNALKWSISEMDRRYKLLQENGVRDIDSYKRKRESGEMHIFTDPDTGDKVTQEMENLPAIVIVIDELSDLMASNGKEVESSIVRIAQMSRAVGIHLIISTQRPSVEVITGLIKANLPTRIALKVNSNIDSRTIIDRPGAEKLIGNGDMLFLGPQNSNPIRLQSPFVKEDEVQNVVRFIRRQAESVGAYSIDEDFESDSENGVVTTARGIESVDFDDSQSTSSESEDPIYEEAKELVITAGKASTSYIQRKLRVGYSRAARLIDELEDNGIVGPAEGSKPRNILVEKEADDTQDMD